MWHGHLAHVWHPSLDIFWSRDALVAELRAQRDEGVASPNHRMGDGIPGLLYSASRILAHRGHLEGEAPAELQLHGSAGASPSTTCAIDQNAVYSFAGWLDPTRSPSSQTDYRRNIALGKLPIVPLFRPFGTVGYPSGQRGLTVNQLGFALRWFESITYHQFSFRGGKKTVAAWTRDPARLGEETPVTPNPKA